MIYIKLIPFLFLLITCSKKPQEGKITVNNEETLVVEEKRAPAKTVSPIIIGKVKYVPSLNEIIAIDTESERELWRKTIYDISYDKNLERDVQDIFIDSLAFADNSLIIRNESNNLYFLELNSKKVYPNYFEIEKLVHQGYSLSLSDSYKTEFEYYKTSDSLNNQLNKAQCIEQNLLYEISTNELNLKLSNGQFFMLKKSIQDEQFYGYSFRYFDPVTNLYVLWENWLEAGHPIIVNANNGEIWNVFGETFSTNRNRTLTANFASDLGAGWTPNGVQLLNLSGNKVDKLFEFNPIELLHDNLGPIDVVWKNDSTVIIQFTKLNQDGKFSTIFKQIQFKKKEAAQTKIDFIREKFGKITNKMDAGEYTNTEFDVDDGNGTVVQYKRAMDGDQLRFMSLAYCSDHGCDKTAYYFWDDQLIFEFKENSYWVGNTDKVYEKRNYYYNLEQVRSIEREMSGGGGYDKVKKQLASKTQTTLPLGPPFDMNEIINYFDISQERAKRDPSIFFPDNN